MPLELKQVQSAWQTSQSIDYKLMVIDLHNKKAIRGMVI